MRSRGILGEILAVTALLAMIEPGGGGHKIGPGRRSSLNTHGTRVDVEKPKHKKKSESLKRMLKK